jgi:dynein heavy chain
LHFIETFKTLLAAKRTEIDNLNRRYRNGVEKLLTTAETVSEMQATLKALQPQLISTSIETEQILRHIESQKSEADEASKIIREEEKQAEKNASDAKRIKQECENDLATVLPVLMEAEKALETLNKNDVYEIKSMKSPPQVS